MQEEDRELYESGAGEPGAAEGASPADLRLSRSVHEGGADEPVEGVLALADPADDPVPPSDVCAASEGGPGAGAFDFLGGQEAERVKLIDQALVKDENEAGRVKLIDKALVKGENETDREACVGHIKAFVRGGREGVERLRKVLPSIFRTFPGLKPFDVLVECGLEPISTDPVTEFPTFFFNPLLSGTGLVRRASVCSRKRPRPEDDDEDVQLYRSQELLEAYEAARSEWSS